MSRWLTHDKRCQHRRKGENRTSHVGPIPTHPGRHDQSQCASSCGADTPTILAHARAGSELVRLKRLNPVCIDYNVKCRARDTKHHSGDRSPHDIGLGIGQCQIDRGSNNKQADNDHP